MSERLTPLIKIENVAKTFEHLGRNIDVLRGIDLEIGAAEMVSIVGQSGVGKSTFLHILGTLDRPSSGRVLFRGEDVFAYPEPKLAGFRNRMVGFVFQFHYLLPEFSALENVVLPTLIQRMKPAEGETRARKLLERVGLKERLSHKPAELSGGEQQRVALARALVMNPGILLADEPTGNLDEKTSEEMHELFLELNRDLGVTFIVVTHNERLAAQLPRRLTMHDGRLYEA